MSRRKKPVPAFFPGQAHFPDPTAPRGAICGNCAEFGEPDSRGNAVCAKAAEFKAGQRRACQKIPDRARGCKYWRRAVPCR